MDFYTMGLKSDNETLTFQSSGAPDKEVIHMVAFTFKDGVMVAAGSRAIMGGDILKDGVIAADSRASMEGDISSQYVKKIVEINPHILVPMVVMADDCQSWIGELDIKYQRLERENKRIISAAEASKLLENIVSRFCGWFLGTMIAGWDKEGPELYYVDGERRVEGKIFSIGSGSRSAYDFLVDCGYRYDTSVEEAARLARVAIANALCGYHGVTSVYHVGPNGWKKLSGDDVASIHFNYNPNVGTGVEHEDMAYYWGPNGWKKFGDDPKLDDVVKVHSIWDPNDVDAARWKRLYPETWKRLFGDDGARWKRLYGESWKRLFGDDPNVAAVVGHEMAETSAATGEMGH